MPESAVIFPEPFCWRWVIVGPWRGRLLPAA